MSFDTYANLKTAMSSWAERSDLAAALYTDFVSLADARIRKDLARAGLRLREMEQISDLTPTSGVASLPSNFMAMKRVQSLESNPRRLEYKTQDWLDEAYPAGDSASPSFYTIVGASLYMFPLTTSNIRITYWAYPDVLSDSNTSNWLLAKYPDVYLYAGLIELEIYAGNDEQGQKWAGAYQAALEGMSASNKDDGITSGTSRTASIGAQ